MGYYDTPQVVQCAMSSFFKKGLDKKRKAWYNKDNEGVKPMKTEEEKQIENLMKSFNLEWEQAAMIALSLIPLALKRKKEGKNNGNHSKMQTCICQEDSER